jgi:hypothetical protein
VRHDINVPAFLKKLKFDEEMGNVCQNRKHHWKKYLNWWRNMVMCFTVMHAGG